MNAVDFSVLFVTILFVVIFYRLGLIAVLKSFLSFLLSLSLAVVCLTPFLNLLIKLGWRENIFTPLVGFPLLIIVFWGVAMSLLSFLPVVWENGLSSVLSIPLSILYGLSVCAVLMLIFPQLISARAISTAESSVFVKNLNKSEFYQKTKQKFLGPIDQEMAKSIVVPSQDTAIIKLNLEGQGATISAGLSDEMFALTNNARRQKGVQMLERDKLLDAVAISYADEIFRSKRFSHIDSSGHTPDERAKELGLKYNYMGENLAIAPTVEAAQTGLMESSTHRQNIESPVFRRVGIGVIEIGTSGKLVVEEFAN